MTATDVNHRAGEALEEELDSSNGECESIHGCDREAVWLHHWTCKCFPNGQLLCDNHKTRGSNKCGPYDRHNGLTISCGHCQFFPVTGLGVYTPI